MKNLLIAAAVALVAVSTTLGISAVAGDGHGHAKTTDKATMTIYDTANKAGFKTLVAAVDAADLKKTLQSEGPFTVFAPTDEAFAKLPEGALEGLLADKKALTDVLLYHVVSGEVMAADVVKIDSAEMANGKTAKIASKDGVMIAGVKVVKTDIVASNGVIHVVDAVMMPPSE